MGEVFVGDIGTKFTLDTEHDLVACGATVTKIYVRKPNGIEVIWDGTIENTSYVYYITEENDLDISGTWRFQVYVEMPGWKGRGEEATKEINKHI